MDGIDLQQLDRTAAAPLAVFLRETFLSAYAHCAPAADVEEFLQRSYAAEQQAGELSDPQRATWLLRVDRHWAGVTQLNFAGSSPCPLPGRAGQLARVYLRAQFHGLGLAARLLERAYAELRARGFDGVWLSVWEHAPQAQAFYRKQGFSRVGDTQFVVGGTRCNDWLLYRPLPADADPLAP